MKYPILLTAAAAAIAPATPAFAQDDSQPFSGVYVSGTVGYDVQKNDVGSIIQFDRNGDNNFGDPVVTATGANAFSTGFCDGRARSAVRLPSGCENDRSRISYSGRIGFDKQMGPFVVGAVGEFGKTNIVDYVSAYSTTPAAYVLSRSIDWEASARLRAGYAANTTLFYATGGAGYAQIDHGFATTNVQNAFSANGEEDRQLGFVVGGGLEQKIARNLSIGLEYSYHDYKDDEHSVRVTQGTAAANNPFVLAPNTAGTTMRRSDDNFRWHSVRATLGFRF